MQGRILLPGEVGSQIEPRLTLEGMRQLIRDIRDAGQRMPSAILVSEYDRRDLNQDLLGASVEPVKKEDQKAEHDFAAIGVIDGVLVRSHADVPRGKARLVYPPVAEQAKPMPSGRIIVGAG